MTFEMQFVGQGQGLPDGASACKGQGQGQGQAAQALTVPALAWRFGLQSAPMAFP